VGQCEVSPGFAVCDVGVRGDCERLWETKLPAVEEAEQEFEAWRRQNGAVLTDEERVARRETINQRRGLENQVDRGTNFMLAGIRAAPPTSAATENVAQTVGGWRQSE